MQDKNINRIKKKFRQLKCCVIIPTYNNENTLESIINNLLKLTDHIIVIDDGSTDSTNRILKQYKNIHKLKNNKNSGKGYSLKKGMNYAKSIGLKYAITIDSDGQHYTKDIPKFIEEIKIKSNNNIIIIGSRDMNKVSVPFGSRFGNNFSNFWFNFQTNIKLKDTQSGYRLYPLNVIEDINLISTRYEFEIEILVKSAWKGIEIKNIPINVSYKKDRISHFRPFIDFLRISIINIWLVLYAILYIKPRDFIRNFREKDIRKFINDDILESKDSSLKKAFSISLGIFIGLTPFWGYQTLIVLFLAVIFKLNKVLAFTFSNISIPPLIPIIIYFSINTGKFIVGDSYYNNSDNTIYMGIQGNLYLYLIGSFTLAFFSSIIIGLISYISLKAIETKLK